MLCCAVESYTYVVSDLLKQPSIEVLEMRTSCVRSKVAARPS
jgi:hypothetical protein